MGLTKTEINLRRLLVAAPLQKNQAKLIDYVATLRVLLKQLAEETTPEGLLRVSEAKLNDYSEKIESFASSLVSPEEIFVDFLCEASNKTVEETKVASPPGLRKRPAPSSSVEEKSHDVGSESSPLVKLDAGEKSHTEKHRKLQEDLSYEMLGMARQLKDSSLLTTHSLKNVKKILGSMEKDVKNNLASTSHANVRALNVFSQSPKTSCFTWLLMFVMLMVFMMVVFLVRII